MAHVKKLVGFFFSHKRFLYIHSHSHQNFTAHSQKLFYHLHLHRSKTSKAIQNKHAASKLLRKNNLFCQNLQHFFRCHVMFSQIIPKCLIKNRHILKLHLKKSSVRSVLLHSFQFLLSYLILHKFRDQRFYLVQISGLFHLIFQINQIFLMLLDQLLKDHIFPCLFQNLSGISAYLLKNTKGKAFKAEYINIQDSSVRMHFYQCFLRLHGKLFRHDHIKKLFRMLSGFLNHALKNCVGLSGTGISNNKLKRHNFLHTKTLTAHIPIDVIQLLK